MYAGLAAQALKTDHAAAYAVWTLARSIDHAGSGWVCDSDLRSAAAALADWDDRKYRRARADAIALGIMTLAGDRLYLASLENAAYRLGAQRIGHTPIGVDVRTLSKVKSWRAALRDSFLAGQRPNPISQKIIQRETGLTPRTQYTYSKMNRRAVTVIHNYARLQKRFDPAHLAIAREYDKGAYCKDGELWTALGNTYDISEAHYPRLKHGRTKRAQSVLNGLVISAAGQQTNRPARMYHETWKSAFDEDKKSTRGKVKRPDRLYVISEAMNAHVRTASNGRPLFVLWVSFGERID